MIFDAEIRETAGRHNLPVGLVHAIVQVESGGDPWAVRFEPDFKRLYLDGRAWKVFGAISHDTEVMLRATSFGLMQVMGQVAREKGFEGVWLTQLCSPGFGLEYGCRQLRTMRERWLAAAGWDGVIAAYNAGTPRRSSTGQWQNQAYVDKVRHYWPDEGQLNGGNHG